MTGSEQQQVSVSRWQRPLLPGAMLEAHDGRRSARDWIVDVAMFGLAAGISVFVATTTWSDHDALEQVLDIVIGTVIWLSLWLRRSHAAGVAWVAIAASAVSAAAGGPALMALFNAAIRTSGRTLAGIVGLTVVSTATLPLLYPGSDPYGTQLLLGNLITAVVVGWGLFVRAQRELVQSLRDRADRLESEQRLRVEQAREAERLRIAREMHDVLAHRISLLSLHAGALEFRPDAPPDEVAEAAAVIRASAHAALEELREVIGVLRDGEQAGTPEPPQPTLAEIPALVDESRAAGMRVGCRIDAPGVEALPAAVGRTAYRVVQEGLTNARKHAPAAAVEVTVAADDGPRLVVEVLSRRPVGVAATAALAGAGGGAGLIGLAERVALAGGELEHGPDAAGAFVLRATLPWAP
jgi:signal transduction histidine kinase